MPEKPDRIGAAILASDAKLAPEEAKAALEGAVDIVAAVKADPVAAAAKLTQHENEMRGAYSIVKALAFKMGADKTAIVLNRQEWQSPDPAYELEITPSKAGHVTIILRPRG